MGLEELVRRIRMGDKAAVKDLISIYGNAVYLRAFERTQDKELAREAARQTFGQFVAVVQQQPDEDGWSLWFGDLIERNISAYAQIAPDMGLIEDELERELYGEPEESPESVSYQQPSARLAPPPQQQRQSGGRAVAAPEPAEKSSRSSGRSIRDEVFSEPYRPRKKKKRGGGTLSIILLILVCLILLWVVGGVAMTMKWIPEYDLGYTWFNLNVFKLF
jgi:hypothetical protein